MLQMRSVVHQYDCGWPGWPCDNASQYFERSVVEFVCFSRSSNFQNENYLTVIFTFTVIDKKNLYHELYIINKDLMLYL